MRSRASRALLGAALAPLLLGAAGPRARLPIAPPTGAAAAEDRPEDHLLGLGPGRRGLEQDGVTLDAYVNLNFGWNADGGRDTGGGYGQSVDLFVRADTARMGLWEGGSFLLQVKSNAGECINPDVGGLAQVNDDSDFDELAYVDQLYYEHGWSRRVRFRVGYLDYQTIVDRNAYANSEDVQFGNAALDNNLLVPLQIGFGAALFAQPADWLDLVVGTADADNRIRLAGWETAFGDDENLMAYGELNLKPGWSGAHGALPGNYRLGAYYDPRSRAELGTADVTRGTTGAWASLDQLVLRERETDRQGLGLFYRFGWREEEAFPVSGLHSAGLEYLGPLPGRDADECGVGFFTLVASDDYERLVDPAFSGETGYEAYYRIQTTPWLAITPSVQYVEHPGGQDSTPDALALFLRVRVRL